LAVPAEGWHGCCDSVCTQASERYSYRRQHTMHETHDIVDTLLNEIPFDFQEDLPEPPEYWSPRDFADVVPMWRTAS